MTSTLDAMIAAIAEQTQPCITARCTKCGFASTGERPLCQRLTDHHETRTGHSVEITAGYDRTVLTENRYALEPGEDQNP